MVSDNWGNTSGTGRSKDGQYHGDVSAIKITGGQKAARYMYWGPTGTNRDVRIEGMPKKRTPRNTGVFTSGAATGGLGGYKVKIVGAKKLSYGNGIYGRNMSVAVKSSGTCANHGDSGGPVYTISHSTGFAIARGVISGGNVVSGVGCVLSFTDIRDAWAAMPGTLLR